MILWPPGGCRTFRHLLASSPGWKLPRVNRSLSLARQKVRKVLVRLQGGCENLHFGWPLSFGELRGHDARHQGHLLQEATTYKLSISQQITADGGRLPTSTSLPPHRHCGKFQPGFHGCQSLHHNCIFKSVIMKSYSFAIHSTYTPVFLRLRKRRSLGLKSVSNLWQKLEGLLGHALDPVKETKSQVSRARGLG